jgi:hypothetical protein
MYDGTGQYSVRNTVLYNGQWSFDKMNGHGSFFFADGGKCTCSQWVDDFFPDNTSGERMFPDGQPCNLKATDFKDKKSARFRRRWEDGVFYENGWRSVCQEKAASKPASTFAGGAQTAETAKSAQMVNFRGILILVPHEEQVRRIVVMAMLRVGC